MTSTENAKIIDAEELKELIEEQHANPCVERLIFLETKGKGEDDGHIFPAYVEAWAYDDIKPAQNHKSIMFKMALTQYIQGETAMVQVVVRESDIGKNKRIWDKPPKKSLRDETPWVETEVQ